MTVISRSAAEALDATLREELWRRITSRLAAGRTLVTRRQFQAAIEGAYCEFTGQVPPAAIRRSLRAMVERVHAERPETFLARGVQNAMEKAFGRGIARLAWNEVVVQRHGTASVRRFLRRSRIKGLLQDIRLDPNLLDVSACVRQGVQIAREQVPVPVAAPTAAAAPAVLPPQASPFILDEDDEAADDAEDAIDADLGADLEAEDTARARAFAGLRRLRPDVDPLLRLLLRHRAHVIGAGDRTPLMTELLRSRGCLDLALLVLEHADGELARLAERQPPYDAFVFDAAFDPEAKGELRVDEAFLGDLRRLRPEAYAERLRDDDPEQVARARSQVDDFLRLLAQLLTPTPFRMKVRLLLANRVLQAQTPELERLYSQADDTASARRRGEALLAGALERVLADASPDEAEAARRRRRGLQMGIEQKLAVDVDAESVLDALDQVAGDADDSGAQPGDEDIDVPETAEPIELSEIEKRRGAQMGTVAVREGIRWQRTTGVVMPSPDDSQRFVLAERDGGGELVPQTRRGRPRYVDRQPDGSWRALTG